MISPRSDWIYRRPLELLLRNLSIIEIQGLLLPSGRILVGHHAFGADRDGPPSRVSSRRRIREVILKL